MDEMNIQTAILCLSPNPAGSLGMENRLRMRQHNLYARRVCDGYPGRFGFYAEIGFLDDVEGGSVVASLATFNCL
jgi:hypothetical protein